MFVSRLPTSRRHQDLVHGYLAHWVGFVRDVFDQFHRQWSNGKPRFFGDSINRFLGALHDALTGLAFVALARSTWANRTGKFHVSQMFDKRNMVDRTGCFWQDAISRGSGFDVDASRNGAEANCNNFLDL